MRRSLGIFITLLAACAPGGGSTDDVDKGFFGPTWSGRYRNVLYLDGEEIGCNSSPLDPYMTCDNVECPEEDPCDE